MEEETAPKPQESTLEEWAAEEFNSYTRNWIWYLIVALASLSVMGFSIYRRDWFMVAIVIILDGFIFWYIRKKPSEVSYRITELGIHAGENFYPYSDIHSFWITFTGGNRLNVVFNKKYLPQLSIKIEGLDPLTLKTILGKYLPEQEERTESIVDRVSRLLRL